MRRNIIFSLLVMATACTGLRAQIVVDSLGNVGIGTTTTTSQISIGGGDPQFYSCFNPSGYNKVVGIRNSYVGLSIYNLYSNSRSNIGLEVLPSTGTSNQVSYAIRSFAGATTNRNYAIYGTLPPFTTGSNFQVAIFGTDGDNAAIVNGDYAGYFCGDVRVTGTLTSASIVSPSASSVLASSALAGSASVTKYPNIERVSEKFQNVGLLEIYDMEQLVSSSYEENELDSTTLAMLDAYPELQSSYKENTRRSAPMAPIRYGLAADELREIYPELVYEDANGNLGINYVEMVPLLVQSIKELRAEIDELKGSGTRKVAANTRNASTGIDDAALDLLSMSQNDPNPFTVETTIALTIPEDVKTALIIVYDMSGKKVKQIEVLGRGDTSAGMTAEGLTSGMYLYSLIADGKVVSTKRMILN